MGGRSIDGPDETVRLDAEVGVAIGRVAASGDVTVGADDLDGVAHASLVARPTDGREDDPSAARVGTKVGPRAGEGPVDEGSRCIVGVLVGVPSAIGLALGVSGSFQGDALDSAAAGTAASRTEEFASCCASCCC